MATATVARPAQALRNRRDAPRPSLATAKRAASSIMENGITTAEGVGNKRRRLNEPHVITKAHILSKFKDKPPSLVVHLHQSFFKFDGQEGTFSYDSPMKRFLEHLRRETIPHDMLEELHGNNVTFYDGCLIVETRNHRSVSGRDKERRASAAGDSVKYSMHNYNSYVTPSAFAPYPKKAKETTPEKAEAANGVAQDRSSEEKQKEDGPKIATLVMFPTDLSRHKEMLILANTPMSEMRSTKKTADGTTPSTAQPPTPGVGVHSPGQEQKMCVNQQNFYQTQADILVTTQPPLFLEPAKNPQEAQKALDLLAHPLHNDTPPSPKTRKRTTAEMAADDAQAAESERRMLIMDERIKPAAAGASDNAGNAQAMGFSRFKTISMVREKHEEQERQRKEEEAQAALQRRQQEEQSRQAAEAKQHQQEQQRILMNRRQAAAREHMRNQQQMAAQQQAAYMAQNHGHPQQGNMMSNQQQANFHHNTSMAQSSPVVRQQTPMMNSSPMMPQNGFPMTATSSQGPGSPPRPTSGAVPNPNVAMARQASQQQHGSRNATPQIAQGTPNMAGIMANRQPSQTPRMAQASPAPGTPASLNMPNGLPMQNPHQANATPEQIAILQARQQQMQSQNQSGGMNAGSPGQQNLGQAGSAMTPEHFQNAQQQQRMREQMIRATQQGATPQQLQAMRHRMLLSQQQQQQQAQYAQQQRMMQQQSAGQAGSPHPGMQQTPQMGHGHPGNGGLNEASQGQQMTAQQQALRSQQANAMRQAQAQLQSLAQQWGGYHKIPANMAQQLPPPVQQLLRQQQQRMQAFHAQQMAMRAQQAQNAGQPVAGSGNADPEYMQTLRNHQAMLAAQQQQAQQGGPSMGMNVQNQQFGGQNVNNDNLAPHFQAMQQTLNRAQQGGSMGQ